MTARLAIFAACAWIPGALPFACQSGESPDGPGADSNTRVIRDAAALRPSLDAGLQRWRAQNQAADQTYFYWRVRPGGESGVREVTGVQIINGLATHRYITRARINHAGDGEATIFERVRETVGTGRSNPAGFPARTLETLYENCRRILPRGANDPAARQNHFELRLDQRGVLRACWIAPKQCQGDCATDHGTAGLVFRKLSSDEVNAFLNTTNPRLSSEN